MGVEEKYNLKNYRDEIENLILDDGELTAEEEVDYQRLMQDYQIWLKKFAEKLNRAGIKTLSQYKALFYNSYYSTQHLDRALHKLSSTTEKLKFLYEMQADHSKIIKGLKQSAETKSPTPYLKLESGEKVSLRGDDEPLTKKLSDEVWEFQEHLDIQIKLLENLNSLENETPLETENKTDSERTAWRIMHLFDEIIPNFKALDATVKAEFINFVAGYSSESIRQKYTQLSSRERTTKAHTKDMEVVNKWIGKLNLKKSN